MHCPFERTWVFAFFLYWNFHLPQQVILESHLDIIIFQKEVTQVDVFYFYV